MTCAVDARYAPKMLPRNHHGPKKEQTCKKEARCEEHGIVNPKFGSSDGASRDQPVHGATVESSLVQQTKSLTSPRRDGPSLLSKSKSTRT